MNIVATIKERHDINIFSKIKELQEMGVNYFRFNYAKIRNDKDELRFFQMVNKVSDMCSDVNIIIDVPYPGKKNRLVCKERKILIESDKEYILNIKNDGLVGKMELSLEDEIDCKDLYPGKIIIYDMGECGFVVKDILDEKKVVIKALNTFEMYSNKGISIGDVNKKNYFNIIKKIHINLKNVNCYALSFVESIDDLKDAVELKKIFPDIKFISKIETEKAMDNFEEVAINSDAIMLGRGDLIVNSSVNKLMEYETKAKNLCEKNKCEYYIASGFLNSLLEKYIPSHSDVIDISFAISLNPEYLVLNTDLVVSKRIGDAIKLINELCNN